MKTFFSILISLTILAIVYFFIDFSNLSKKAEQPVYGERYEKWLLDRYKDPATGKIPDNIRRLELNFAKNLQLNNSLRSKNSHIQAKNEWGSRGPYYIGGRTRALALDVNDENRILAGGVDAGMYLSTDGGSTWVKTTKNNQFPSVTTIAQDTRPGKQNIWYHGTGERLGSRVFGNGIFKSTDNGNSWFRLNSTVNGSIGSYDNAFDFVFRVKTNPKAPLDRDEVYAAVSNGGIFRSTDGGLAWEPVLGGGVSNNLSAFTDIEITPKGVFYATLSSNSFGATKSIVKGIFRSTNGTDWTNITPKDFPPTFNRTVIGVNPQNENTVYFLAETPGYGLHTTNSQRQDLWHSLFKYEYIKGDGADSNGKWTNLTQNLPNPELVRHQMNSQGGYDLLIKVHPADSNIVYIGGVNLYRSDTGWQTKDFKIVGGTCPTEDCNYKYRYDNHHADQHTLIFSPSNPNITYTGTDGGVHKTLDNKATEPEWISLNNGYLTTQFYCVALDHATESNALVGGLQDNGSIFTANGDSKAQWYEVLRADGFHCAIADSNKFILTSQNSSYAPGIKIFLTKVDENGKLIKGARIDPIGGKEFIWNTPFALDPNNNNRLYLAGGRTVWRNSDLSKIPTFDFPNSGWKTITKTDSTSIGWTELKNTSVDITDSNEQRITAIAVSKIPANIVYYGTNDGKVYRLDNADKGNPAPVNITGNLFRADSYVSSISIDPEDASKLMVCFSNYNIESLFYSTDSGNSWTTVGGNLETTYFDSSVPPAINTIKIIKNNGRTAYLAGTTIGLFITTYLNGNGTVWSQEAINNVGYKNVFSVDYRPIDSYTVIGTYATGVYGTHLDNLPQPPTSLSLISPNNNTKNLDATVTFKWGASPDAYFYQLQVATDKDFQNIIYEKNDIGTTEQKVTTLHKGYRDYYWRVAAINSGGISNFSETWTFQTGLGSPNLLFPKDETKNIGDTVNLVWEKLGSDDVTTYKVQIGANGFFTKIVDEAVTSESNHTFENLERGKRYFWRVRAHTNSDTSEYSDRFSFTTSPPTSVDRDELQGSVKIYPNPATNFIMINLSSIKSIVKNISIYDQRGRLLKTYINENTDISKIDIRHLQSGEYFLKIQFDDFTISKRFIKL